MGQAANPINRDRFLDLIADAADELPDDEAADLLCYAEDLVNRAERRVAPHLVRRYRLRPWLAGSYAKSLILGTGPGLGMSAALDAILERHAEATHDYRTALD